MMLKCEKQCVVYNETAKSLAEILREYVGLTKASIGLEPKSNDFTFDTEPNVPIFCKNGWVLID